MLVHTSLEDHIVPYWIPLQWVAKRRYLLEKQANNYRADSTKPLICRIDTKSGHHSHNLNDSLRRVSIAKRLGLHVVHESLIAINIFNK